MPNTQPQQTDTRNPRVLIGNKNLGNPTPIIKVDCAGQPRYKVGDSVMLQTPRELLIYLQTHIITDYFIMSRKVFDEVCPRGP